MEGGFLPEQPEDRKTPPANTIPSDRLTSRSAQLPTIPTAPSLPNAAHVSGCSRCSSLSFSKEFYDAFKVLLCNECRRSEKLISKTNAKSQFCITDGDIKKLGGLKRSNPHKKNWQPMVLLLQSQVEEIAIAKHGSLENIAEKQNEILDQKLQARLRKRDDEKARKSKEEATLERIKKRIATQNDEPTTGGVDLPESDVEDI